MQKLHELTAYFNEKKWFFVKFGWFRKLGGSYAILSSIAFFLFFRFNLISFFLERIAWRSSIEYLGFLLVSAGVNKLNTRSILALKLLKDLYPYEIRLITLILLKALASWGGEVSETKNHPLCGCEIKVKQLKNHPFLIK